MEGKIADTVHEVFASLPPKCKPRLEKDGRREWVPLSGVVIIKEDGTLTCVALGWVLPVFLVSPWHWIDQSSTGMKCLPASKFGDARGNILHDWHAEIIAIRAFNRFLIDECYDLASGKIDHSAVVCRVDESGPYVSESRHPFSIRDDLSIAMYCSEAPCGDASMELIMEAQADPTPWPVNEASDGDSSTLLGRASFSQLGIVRGKPARGDSPMASSKSCSDKLALKQCTSLLSGPASLLLSPKNAYLRTLIVPTARHRPEACVRAFGKAGRMQSLAGKQFAGDYSFLPFEVQSTSREFQFSRTTQSSSSKPSNISAVWTGRHQETLVNGVRAGWRQSDSQGKSILSRRQMLQGVENALSCLSSPSDNVVSHFTSYRALKQSDALKDRETLKEEVFRLALQGWCRNETDNFVLE